MATCRSRAYDGDAFSIDRAFRSPLERLQAMEYQHLHQDGGQDAQLVSSHRLEWARDVGVDVNVEEPEGDFVGVRKAMEATAGVTISWCLSDWTFENGPIRQIPGSVRSSHSTCG